MPNNHNRREIRVAERPDERSVSVSETSLRFSGPLPHPDILQAYESVGAGFAERIVTMAESQSEHRKKLEKEVVKSDTLRATLGLVFAFLIVVLSILSAVYLAIHDKTAAALAIAGGSLFSVVGAFIYQKSERSGNTPETSESSEKEESPRS